MNASNVHRTVKILELHCFKTETVNRKPKTAVLIGFSITKKRIFGAGFDNRNNTSVELVTPRLQARLSPCALPGNNLE